MFYIIEIIKSGRNLGDAHKIKGLLEEPTAKYQ